MARLLLIAEELGESQIVSRLLSHLQSSFLPWLLGSNRDAILYDRVWRGLVPKEGLHDRNADFGAGWYNDHHFHYGYHIYAYAAIAKIDPAWGAKWKEQILSLVRDIANPSELVQAQEQQGESLDAALAGSGEVPKFAGIQDDHFPTLRHMDVFESHSWANALFASPIGRNQESSTEAVNAYYAIALLGKALDDPSLTYLGEVLTSLELTGTHRYWHITSEKSVYPMPFAENRCVGMVWSSKAVVQTWFAVGLAYVHGINVLPITPISELVLSPAWVVEQYPAWVASLPGASPAFDDVWMGFLHADEAVIDPESAWRETLKLERFDAGASRTNFLYWIATRPQPQ